MSNTAKEAEKMDKKTMWIIGIVLLVLVGGGLFFYAKKKKAAKKKENSTTTTTKENPIDTNANNTGDPMAPADKTVGNSSGMEGDPSAME